MGKKIIKAIFENASYVKRLTQRFLFFAHAVAYSIPVLPEKNCGSLIKCKNICV